MKDHNKELIVKYLIGTISPEELERFEGWLNESDENMLAFEEIKTAWVISRSEDSNTMKGRARVWNNILSRMDALRKDYRHIHRKQQVAALTRAAVVFIAVGLGAFIMYITSTYTKSGNSNAASFNAVVHNDTILIESNMGSRSEVLLPDGSKVWLNGGSKLKMLPDFYTGKRTVYLTGEAYFNVTKKGENDYFRVKTSDIQIKVLGTQFNLKSYPEEGTIETTLEEGSVVIEKETNDRLMSIAALSPNEKAIFVKKDGKLTVDNINPQDEQEQGNINGFQKLVRKEHLFIKEDIDTHLYTSWRNGYLKFKDEKFENILVRMERWYNVKLEIKNPKLASLRFTASFKNETIEQALYALKLTHAFDYKHNIEENLITIK